MTYLPMLDRPAPMDRLKRMARIMSMVTTIAIGAVRPGADTAGVLPPGPLLMTTSIRNSETNRYVTAGA